MIRAFFTLTLLLSLPSQASDKMIIGHMYQLPVDCGHDAELKPVYTNVFDQINGNAHLSTRNYINSDQDMGVYTHHSIDTPSEDTRLFVNLNILSSQHNSDLFSFRTGCINGRFYTSAPSSVRYGENHKLGIEVHKQFLLPKGDGTDYGFYANLNIEKLNYNNTIVDNSYARLSLSCQGQSDISIEKNESPYSVGSHSLTIPIDEFDLTGCTSNRLMLRVTLSGHGIRLNALQAMLYETF